MHFSFSFNFSHLLLKLRCITWFQHMRDVWFVLLSYFFSNICFTRSLSKLSQILLNPRQIDTSNSCQYQVPITARNPMWITQTQWKIFVIICDVKTRIYNYPTIITNTAWNQTQTTIFTSFLTFLFMS